MSATPSLYDLCGGCGHVGLVAASAIFPTYNVTIVDTASVALGIAARRANAANLNNVTTQCQSVNNLTHHFDVAVALHACAGATDAALVSAVRARARVAVAPCCVGGLVSPRTAVTGCSSGEVVDPARPGQANIDWLLPRSRVFRALLNVDQYAGLARAADFGDAVQRDDWRRVAKALLEWDRVLWLKEMGYVARLVKMRPLNCTPKNDIIVAWPIELHVPDWPRDELANGLVRDVIEGSVINGLCADEVETVAAELQSAMTLGGMYRSTDGLGARRRKVVHAVAESLGLYHKSVGRGARRVVLVQKSIWWPLYFDTYIALGGPALDSFCNPLLSQVPNACLQRRIVLRGSPMHLTIVGPDEIRSLPHHLRTDRQACLRFVHTRLLGTTFETPGVGCARARPKLKKANTGLASKGGRILDIIPIANDVEKDELDETYFLVINWPEVQQLRNELGLPHRDLHITLGFTNKDLHTVVKDSSSLIYQSAHTCSPWLS